MKRYLTLPIIVMCMLGCQNSLLDRSLIFSTNTSVGLDISVSPVESGEPVRLVLGYKRFEGVINPVFYDHRAAPRGGQGGSTMQTVDTCDPNAQDYYRGEAYSVIAKFAGGGRGAVANQADGSISGAQWFATGRAADWLAVQPGIAGAVSGSSEVAEAAALQRAMTVQPTETVHAIAVTTAYEILQNEPFKSDAEAQAVLARMNGAADQLLTPRRRLMPGNYGFNTLSNTLTVSTPSSLSNPPTFAEMHARYKQWADSANSLSQAATAQKNGATITFSNPGGAGTSALITANNLADLPDAARLYQETVGEFSDAISASPVIAEAVDFVFTRLLNKE